MMAMIGAIHSFFRCLRKTQRSLINSSMVVNPVLWRWLVLDPYLHYLVVSRTVGLNGWSRGPDAI